MHIKNKKKLEFSKVLLVQESILIWITTISFIILAFLCINKQYFGELPWISVMAGLPWTAYGVSQVAYYNKSKKENTKDGIVYQSALYKLNQELEMENDIPVG